MSKKTIQIDDIDVALECNGATYIRYRNYFKDDLFVALERMGKAANDGEIPEGAAETMLRAMYIMAQQGRPKEEDAKEFEEWLSQFSMLGPVNASNDIYDLLLGDRETLDEAKKNEDQQSAV